MGGGCEGSVGRVGPEGGVGGVVYVRAAGPGLGLGGVPGLKGGVPGLRGVPGFGGVRIGSGGEDNWP